MNLPNYITFFRLFLSPIFIVVFYLATQNYQTPLCNPVWMSVALFITLIQDGTDIIDGVIARRKNQITDLGKIVDPLADYISHFTSFISLLSKGFIPLWAVIIIFYREVLVSTLRIHLAKNNILLGARFSGKLKTVIYGGAINFILFFIILHQFYHSIPIIVISNILISITVAFTIYSGIDYFIATRKL